MLAQTTAQEEISRRTMFAASLKDMRPAEGLMLKTPWNEAGMDTEPPTSVPMPNALPFNACMAPSPRKHQPSKD